MGRMNVLIVKADGTVPLTYVFIKLSVIASAV
jgi:hypothetical protein